MFCFLMVIVFLLFSFLSSSPSNRVDHHFNDFLNNFSFIFQIVCPLFLPITWSCASLSNQGSFFFCFRLVLLVISNSFTLYLIPNGDVSLGSSWPPISGCLIVSTEEEMSILFVVFFFRKNPPPQKKRRRTRARRARRRRRTTAVRVRPSTAPVRSTSSKISSANCTSTRPK